MHTQLTPEELGKAVQFLDELAAEAASEDLTKCLRTSAAYLRQMEQGTAVAPSFPVKFGQFLLKRRLDLGLTPYEAAARCGLDNGAILRHEQGVWEPTLLAAIRHLGALGMGLPDAANYLGVGSGLWMERDQFTQNTPAEQIPQVTPHDINGFLRLRKSDPPKATRILASHFTRATGKQIAAIEDIPLKDLAAYYPAGITEDQLLNIYRTGGAISHLDVNIFITAHCRKMGISGKEFLTQLFSTPQNRLADNPVAVRSKFFHLYQLSTLQKVEAAIGDQGHFLCLMWENVSHQIQLSRAFEQRYWANVNKTITNLVTPLLILSRMPGLDLPAFLRDLRS